MGDHKITEAMSFQSKRPHKRLRSSDAALRDAATQGDIDTLRTLLDTICDTTDIDALDFNGETSLTYAAQEGHTDCVRLLLQRGADVNKPSGCRSTAAHYAAERGHSETLLALLDNAGCDVDARGIWGMTPLMWAAQEGHTECAQLLLERGADISSLDAGEFTAAHFAIVCGHLEVLRLLLASAADPPTLDPMFHFRYPLDISKWTYSFSFALACGCRLEAPSRAIEAVGASCILPFICGYYSLPHFL